MKVSNNFFYKYNNYSRQNSVSFNGKLGDKFVSKIIKGEDVKPKAITKEIKNTFGSLNYDGLEDITESLIDKIRELHSENKMLRNENLYLAKKVVKRDIELLSSFRNIGD